MYDTNGMPQAGHTAESSATVATTVKQVQPNHNTNHNRRVIVVPTTTTSKQNVKIELGNATVQMSLDKGKPFYYRLGAIHCQIVRHTPLHQPMETRFHLHLACI